MGDAPKRDTKHFPELGLPDPPPDFQRLPLRGGRLTKRTIDSSPLYVVTPPHEQMLNDVREGLRRTPKQLSPKYFYDERGSELFEEITRVPEYYLTRVERALLERHIPELIGELRPRSLVELGAGSASKTRIILDAMRSRGAADFYIPIDVSAEFLESA